MRTILPLSAIIAFAGILLSPSATQAHQETSKSGASATPPGARNSTPFKDAPAPEPSPALKTLLDPITKQLERKQYMDALFAADVALKAAQMAKDPVGEAMAQRLRATALEGLNKIDEAITSWKSVAGDWRLVPDGPGQVEALANAGVLLMSGHVEEAKQLIAQAITIAQAEKSRPLQAARELNLAARRAFGKGQIGSVKSLAAAGLSLFEKLSPGSLDMALCLSSLGYAYGTETYYQRALEIIEKVAPGSPYLVSTLSNLGSIARNRGDLVAAENYYRRTLEIEEKLGLAPLDVAVRLYNLGGIAYDHSNLAAAENYFKDALEIYKKITPGSLYMAASLNGLGSVAFDHNDFATAESYFKRAQTIFEKLAPGSLAVASSLHNLGNIAFAHNDLTAAENYNKRALEIRERLVPESLDVAASLYNLGKDAFAYRDFTAAESYYKRALNIRERLAPGSLPVAACLYNLGAVAFAHRDFWDRDLLATENYIKRALDIQDRLVPESLQVSDSLNFLGVVAYLRGDLTTSENYYKRALNIQEKLAPNSLSVANSLTNLGEIAYDHINLAAAETNFKRAQAIFEKSAPGSLNLAACLRGLGTVAWDHGDLATAESYIRRALKIQEQSASGSSAMAGSLQVLGLIAADRSDLAAAENYQKRALEIDEKREPGSRGVADSLTNLGNIAYQRGELLTAESYYKRALEIQEKLAPGSHDVAANLNGLGSVADSRGDLVTAEIYFKRAQAIHEKLAPGSLDLASNLYNLGYVAFAHNDLTAAENYNKRALEIRERLAPGSLGMARSLHHLGMVYEKMQHPAEALLFYSRAANILEAQRNNIAGIESRKLLVEAHTDAFTALMQAYLALHQDIDAFNTLERTRGRSLAENLFEHRQITFDKDVPPTLLAQQKTLDNDRSIALKQRQQLDSKDKSGYDKNDLILQDLNVKQRQLEEKIREVSPRYANLQYPKPLDLIAVQHTLDPGTLLLEYAMDEQKTYLFTVTNNSLHCYQIDVKKKDLLAKVTALSDSMTDENAPRNPGVAIALYDLLLKPAQKEIEGAQRLLFCPEKDLWKLPFCALIDNGNPANPHYLIESKPIHSVVSMNVYAQLLQNRKLPHTATHSLLAFGDPAYLPAPQNHADANNQGIARVVAIQADIPQRLLLGGHSFDRRKITGEQVSAIVALFGQGAVKHLGSEATPSRVLKEAGTARILHFACHGWLDKHDPLASFLALTPEKPKEEFGMLAAYDVIQNLRLDADLVTLAACETGVGEDNGTEGVIGLTRAFQYAGAHSVLVSLWEIDANSSTQLLSGTDPVEPGKAPTKRAIAASFYGALLAGKSKDEALRTAQIALIHGSRIEYRNPQHWAAFSLQGDWK